MFDSESWENEENVSDQSVTLEEQSIADIPPTEKGWRPILKFVSAFLIGAFVFLVPIQWEGQTTIPLDVILQVIQDTSLVAVELFALALILTAAVLTTVSKLHYSGTYPVSDQVAEAAQLEYWSTSKPFWVFRVTGAILAIAILLDRGPNWLLVDSVIGVAWGTLVITIALVTPIGAIFVNLLAELGGLQFVGTLAQPIMRPVYRLPGRSALDSVASWVSSFQIGYYLTRNVFDRGGYHKRDVFVICTCFATANLGTVGALSAVLGILDVFPVIVLLYLLATLLVAAILVRLPPLSKIPEEYITEPDPEPQISGTIRDYLLFAFGEGVRTAKESDSMLRSSVRGFIDGAKLAGTVLGTVLTIAIAVLLIEANTDAFAYISAPLVPILSLLSIPDPQVAAMAIIVAGAEYFVGSTLVIEAAFVTKVFVVVVTSGQAIFFAASAPVMVDMFDDIPIRFRDLFLLLVLRTALLVPIAAVLTHAAAAVGML